MSNPSRLKKKRASGFSEVEVHNLLDEIEEIKPIGLDEWMITESSHAQKWPDKSRTADSLPAKVSAVVPEEDPDWESGLPAISS